MLRPRQAAILTGGLGTRLGALTAAVPKPLLPCGDRPFLAWLMRELMRYGISDFLLLTGHLSDAVQAAVPLLRRHLPDEARIALSEGPMQAGTGGALLHAAGLLEQVFVLSNGDSLIDANLAPLLAADRHGATGRMLLRHMPDASRYGLVRLEGERVTRFVERPEAGQPGLINAGLHVFDRTLLDALTPVCSLGRDVLPRLAAAGALRGTIADGWFVDIGVPDDYARAQQALPARLRRPALLLDRDGVINVDHGWVGTRERFEWIAGAKTAIAGATSRGWHVFVVTNQSGVARGLYTEAALQELHRWMADEIGRAGGTVDAIRYCPTHEEAVLPAYRRVSDWRKPAPGMILDLIRTWELDPARCLLVGDHQRDLDAAAAAGVEARLFTGGDLADFLNPLLSERERCPG